ncbi:MAG: DNA repair protein RecO [Candidatus Dormibacteraceae bacterium]
MTTYREEAVVLRKVDYGEADRIYTLLTRHHGKLGAIAKGVRRTSSRMGPSLEIFGQVDVLLAQGHNLDVVAQAERRGCPRMGAEVERTSYAGLVAELVERATEERTPVEPIYELTCAALDELAREADPRRASAYFLAAFLELFGYAPQLATCVGCDAGLRPEPAAFRAAMGGFLCPRCAEGGSDPSQPLVSPGAIKVLRLIAAGDLATYRRLLLERARLDEIEQVLWAQLEHHLDRRLKSLQFIKQMRGSHR